MSDALAEIRRLYYATTRATIADDFDRAIDLLKSLPDEATRERAAVFMDGLAQMRSEWGVKASSPPRPRSPRRRR
jgi:hypothetical protein